METKMYLNLAVKELDKAIKFFNELGFSIDPKFTNDKGACVVISENIYVMILVKEFYQTFTEKQICDSTTTSEVLISLSMESREKVDEIINKAVQADGILTEARRREHYEKPSVKRKRKEAEAAEMKRYEDEARRDLAAAAMRKRR